jgi:alpha-beta hydrolase superfamily lysophospholipase
MAVKWLQAQAMSEEPDTWLTDVADFSKVFISGDSAGGNIAHNLAVRLGAGSPELAPVLVRGYVLLAPFFGGTVKSKSEAEGPKEAFLNWELINRFVHTIFTLPLLVVRLDSKFNSNQSIFWVLFGFLRSYFFI